MEVLSLGALAARGGACPNPERLAGDWSFQQAQILQLQRGFDSSPQL